ncbi:MAG TPA: Ku protein [Kofleriaceae bacterium]|nr:Ku protein [Kofleriaceae bacterium]
MPTRAIDTATLTFGLVAIPIKIYSTSERSHEVHFHLVHEGCGERLHQQYVCPRHGAVDRDEIIKGYELTRGNFVELSKSELKALEAVASEEIAVQEFVPATAVDPLMFERAYYLGPGKGGERAYRLFRDALAAADLVGIASYSARGKQYVVELLPYETGLAMLQLRYVDEIKPWSEVPAPPQVKPTPAELALARKVIDHLRRGTFDPSRYQDEVKDRVRALIASKAKGGEITAPPSVEHAPVTDLMAALKASLGAPPPKGNGAAKRASGNGAAKRANGNGAAVRPARGASKRAGTRHASSLRGAGDGNGATVRPARGAGKRAGARHASRPRGGARATARPTAHTARSRHSSEAARRPRAGARSRTGNRAGPRS